MILDRIKLILVYNLQLKHHLHLYMQLPALCSIRPESDHGCTFQPYTTPSPTCVSSSTTNYIHSQIYRLYQGPVSVLLKHSLLLPHCRCIFSKICQNKQIRAVQPPNLPVKLTNKCSVLVHNSQWEPFSLGGWISTRVC